MLSIQIPGRQAPFRNLWRRTKMNERIRNLLCALVSIAVLSLAFRPSFACGPFMLDAVFTFTAHPEFPLEKFARGELGIIQPTYARSYLFVAYRYLNGTGFSSQE